MFSLKDVKMRVLFVIGNDEFYRRVLCAAKIACMPDGLTRISEGVRGVHGGLRTTSP